MNLESILEEKRRQRRQKDLEDIAMLSSMYNFDVMSIVSEAEDGLLHQLTWDFDKADKILKPCPCCGSTASLVRLQDVRADELSYIIMCDSCDLQTDEYENPIEGILVWNKRV